MVPPLKENQEIRQAYHVLDKNHWTENQLLAYERVAMAAADAKGALLAAKNEGLQEGKAKGRKEGLEEGKKKAKEAMALNLLKCRVPEETVSLASGFTVAELHLLLKKNT